jgi:L-ascorbate metabolism protein UlaG (beta-lactamase superfamily)
MSRRKQHAVNDAPTRPAHFDGTKYRNPGGPAGNGLWHLLRWAASSKRQRWPRWVEPERRHRLPAMLPAGAVAATFIGQSTFLLQIDGLKLLTDPVYADRVGPFNLAGPRRVRAPGIAFEALPRIDVVLLSHNHYDHLDLPTLRRLQRACDPLILTGRGNEALLRRNGLGRVAELDWWESHPGVGALQVMLTPAQHFSSRHLWDRDETLWGGFVVSGGRQRIYFAGDSGYGEHFREIRRRAGPVDLALIPIGAYEPRWFMRRAHVNPAEAVQIHLDLQSRQSVGMHFGTFQLTDEGIDEPPRALREALRDRGVIEERFVVPEFGETVIVPPA